MKNESTQNSAYLALQLRENPLPTLSSNGLAVIYAGYGRTGDVNRVEAIGIEGTIQLVHSGESCEVSVHVTLFIPTLQGVAAVPMHADHLNSGMPPALCASL